MKVSEEFKIGKHDIGYISPTFPKYFGDSLFEAKPAPTFQKLPKPMNDVDIEYELKPGYSTLGDIVAFLDSAPEDCKDGYANLFYTPACVVYVDWYSFSGSWLVDAWSRGGGEWRAGCRVFSPATGVLNTQNSDPLELRLLTLETWKEKVEKILKV